MRLISLHSGMLTLAGVLLLKAAGPSLPRLASAIGPLRAAVTCAGQAVLSSCCRSASGAVAAAPTLLAKAARHAAVNAVASKLPGPVSLLGKGKTPAGGLSLIGDCLLQTLCCIHVCTPSLLLPPAGHRCPLGVQGCNTGAAPDALFNQGAH